MKGTLSTLGTAVAPVVVSLALAVKAISVADDGYARANAQFINTDLHVRDARTADALDVARHAADASFAAAKDAFHASNVVLYVSFAFVALVIVTSAWRAMGNQVVARIVPAAEPSPSRWARVTSQVTRRIWSVALDRAIDDEELGDARERMDTRIAAGAAPAAERRRYQRAIVVAIYNTQVLRLRRVLGLIPTR